MLYVNNEFKVTDIYLNDGRWHFLCVTWRSFNGKFAIYVDGDLRENGKYLGNGTKINGMYTDQRQPTDPPLAKDLPGKFLH